MWSHIFNILERKFLSNVFKHTNKGLYKNMSNVLCERQGTKWHITFKYKIAMHCNVLLSATAINADDSN